VTRLRYAEVLSRIYGHALMRGLITEHPFTADLLGSRPTERERGGQILPPGVFEAIQDNLPTELTPLAARDKAIMLLLLECGLTSGELRTLDVARVRMNKIEHGQYLLCLDGPRLAQRREVSTTGKAGPALQQWLTFRDDLGKASPLLFRSTKLGTLSKASPLLACVPTCTRRMQCRGCALPWPRRTRCDSQYCHRAAFARRCGSRSSLQSPGYQGHQDVVARIASPP